MNARRIVRLTFLLQAKTALLRIMDGYAHMRIVL